MITNILATLIVCVVTNTYAPKQYKVTQYLTTHPVQVVEQWVDWPSYLSPFGPFGGETVRDNPDKQIVEVREIRKWRFAMDGVPDHVISDRVLRKTERRRKVQEVWTENEVDPSAVYITKTVTNQAAISISATNCIARFLMEAGR